MSSLRINRQDSTKVEHPRHRPGLSSLPSKPQGIPKSGRLFSKNRSSMAFCNVIMSDEVISIIAVLR